METFLTTTLAFPTVIFTVLLALAFAYWTMVIVGAMGVDVLDFDLDGADGAAEGAAEGAMEGAAEGAVEGAAEGAAEGVAEGAAEGAVDGAVNVATAAESAGIIGAIFVTFKLRGAPITLVMSLWLLFSWLVCQLTVTVLFEGAGPSFVLGLALVVGSAVAALPLTSVFVRPLARMLKVERQTRRDDLIGQSVQVATSKVTEKFGTAQVADGGAGLIVQIRCDTDNKFGRGSNALIVSFDPKRQAYEVAELDDLVPSEARAKK